MDFQSLYELYQNYCKLPHGSERAESIRAAIVQADLQRNYYWRFHSRYDLMNLHFMVMRAKFCPSSPS